MLVYGLSLAFTVKRVGWVFAIAAVRNESFPQKKRAFSLLLKNISKSFQQKEDYNGLKEVK